MATHRRSPARQVHGGRHPGATDVHVDDAAAAAPRIDMASPSLAGAPAAAAESSPPRGTAGGGRAAHRHQRDATTASSEGIDTGTAKSAWTETAMTAAGRGVGADGGEHVVEPPPDLPPAPAATSATNAGTALLLLACTAVWYWTSAMNAVASQTFVSRVRREGGLRMRGDYAGGGGAAPPESGGRGGASDTVNASSLVDSVIVMTAVTGLQLLSGAVLGGAVLALLLLLFTDDGGGSDKTRSAGGGSNISSRLFRFAAHLTPSALGWRTAMGPGDILFVSLHAVGSLATNLGFWYGSASLVQIIKLLEPFETLLIGAAANRWIKGAGGGRIDSPTVLSMGLVVSGTFLLLSGRTSKPGQNMSIAFAVASGLCMSTRNVTKKLLRGARGGGGVGGATVGGNAKSQQQQPAPFPPSSSTRPNVNKVVECLTEFVRLSGLGALICSAFLVAAAAAVLALPSSTLAWPAPLLSAVPPHVSVELVAYHALYNMASLTVLGFVAAPTHSLLNVGKRISNVAVAAALFGETLGPSSAYGLGIAAVGGVLYGNRHRWARWRGGRRQQQQMQKRRPSSWWRWLLGRAAASCLGGGGRSGRCGFRALLAAAFCVALCGAVVALSIAREVANADGGVKSDAVVAEVFGTPVRPLLRNATRSSVSSAAAAAPAAVNATEPRLRM